MNSIVALPIAAAVPVASPALANSPPSQGEDTSGAAMLARAETAIETFRTRFISEDFTLDNDGAERVLRYFRRLAEGRPDDESEWSAVIEFFSVHGHVLGWILDGRAEVLICLTAALNVLERNQNKSESTDPILSLIEDHKRANAEYGEAIRDLLPGTFSPDPEKEELYGNRESDARWDLATTVPTTLAGLLAVLKYVEGVSDGKFSPSGRRDNAFDEDLKTILISAQGCLAAHLNASKQSGAGQGAGVMKITSIEKHAGSGIWHGTAAASARNYPWFYEPRSGLRMQAQDEINPRCWMNVEAPTGARQIVLSAVLAAKGA